MVKNIAFYREEYGACQDTVLMCIILGDEKTPFKEINGATIR